MCFGSFWKPPWVRACTPAHHMDGQPPGGQGIPHTWAVCQGSMFPPGPLPPARRPQRVLMTPVGQSTWRQDTYLPRPVSTGHELLT